MLNYRHSFHAGNHADALEHTVQSLIIGAPREKEKPLLYLDIHAGVSYYQLSGEHAERTDEYLEDITRIWQQDDLSAELESYISVVEHFNRNGQLRHYLSLLLITRQLLHKQDSLQATELHPSDFPLLRAEFQKDNRARVGKADGYQQLKVKLSPVSRRDLIPIDLPYETKIDYQAVVAGTHEDYRRFATNTCALWYPVVLRAQIKRMTKELEATGIREILQIELAVHPDSDQCSMAASGMIVINPPWKLEQQMNNALPWLHSKLVPAGTGYATVSWVIPR